MTMYDVLRQGSRLRIVAKRALKAFYVRTLSLVVFASDLEARDTFGGRRGTDAAVVHHPLRSALIAPRTPISRSTAPLLIGYLGRLHPKKNLEVLISAVAEASDDAVLRIAGTGDKAYVDSLMSMVARVGMIERTEWCGFVGGDRRWPFFDELDVFAMPSHYECFGMAGAEAMARGVATIVSHSTGIGEIIDRHGCGLIAAPTVDGFARAIESLDRDRDSLEALKVHSRSVAPLELSMDRYAESIIPHYERLVRV
jgi:glycosyltransferase involved in cell wall biosynthesis